MKHASVGKRVGPKSLKMFLGAIFILRKDLEVGGGSENGNFPLLYAMKMPLRTRWVGGSKKPPNTLPNIKMVPKKVFNKELKDIL